ncbi:MAG: peptidylprolyl isomerase [Candidatus Acidiferrum sp.]
MSQSPENSTSGASLQVILVLSAEEAREVVASLNKEDDFAQVARQKSIDPTADQGGYLGLLNAGELREEVRSALRGTGPGQISPVVQIPSGYAILKITQKEAGNVAKDVIVCGVVCVEAISAFWAFHGVLLFTSVRNSAGGIRRSIHIGTELMHSDLLRLVLGRLIR